MNKQAYLKELRSIALMAVCLFAAPQASAETVTYKYDGLGRVIAACYGTQAKHIAFAYDAAGNRTSVAGAGSCANQAPIALNDSVSGSYFYFDIVDVPVLVNDGDPDGNPLTVTGATCVSSGCTVTITSTTVRIMGTTSGTKTVTYTISDGNGGTAQASASAGSFQDPCPLC